MAGLIETIAKRLLGDKKPKKQVHTVHKTVYRAAYKAEDAPQSKKDTPCQYQISCKTTQNLL